MLQVKQHNRFGKKVQKVLKSHINAKLVAAHGKKQNGHKKPYMFKYRSFLMRNYTKKHKRPFVRIIGKPV